MDRLRDRVFAEIADGNDEAITRLEASGDEIVAGREEAVFAAGTLTTAAPLVAWRASNAVRSRCTRGRTASATERVVRPANRGPLWIATTGILGLILAVLGLFGVPSRVLGPHVARDAKGTPATATLVAARPLEDSPTNAASLDGRYAGRALDLRQEGRYVGVSIRDLPVATWILAKNPETPDNAGFDYGQIDPAELRIVRLRLEKPDGGLLHIDKLTLAARLSADGLAQGAWMYVEYEELGIANYGEIREIRPCPPIPPRPSPDHCLVTAKFEHSAGDLLNLHVDGLAEPLGVTPNHPIWSEDRQQFVRADELDQGELLRTARDQHVRVASLAPARESSAVYNLEVDGEHVYYVSSTGILVHNSKGDAYTAPSKTRWQYITEWHDKRATELFGNGKGRSIGGRHYDKTWKGKDVEFKSDNFAKKPRTEEQLNRMTNQIKKDIKNKKKDLADPHWHFDHDPTQATEMAPLIRMLDEEMIPWTWGKATPL